MRVRMPDGDEPADALAPRRRYATDARHDNISAPLRTSLHSPGNKKSGAGPRKAELRTV